MQNQIQNVKTKPSLFCQLVMSGTYLWWWDDENSLTINIEYFKRNFSWYFCQIWIKFFLGKWKWLALDGFGGEYIGLWHFCQPPLPNVSTTIVHNDDNEDDDNESSFNWEQTIIGTTCSHTLWMCLVLGLSSICFNQIKQKDCRTCWQC